MRFTPDGLATAHSHAGGERHPAVELRRRPGDPRAAAERIALAALLASADGRTFAVEQRVADGSNRGSPASNFVFRIWEGADERVPRVFGGARGTC